MMLKFLRNFLVGLAIAGLGALLLSLSTAPWRAIASTAPTYPPLWSVELSASSNLVVSNGQILVPTADFLPDIPNFDVPPNSDLLYALDPTSGATQWSSEEPVRRILAATNQEIYGSTADNRLVVIDRSTGETLSSYRFSAPRGIPIGGPIGVAGDAFIVNRWLMSDPPQHEVVARRGDDVRWSYRSPPHSQLLTALNDAGHPPSANVRDDKVVLPMLVNPGTDERGYQITVLDGATGAEQWTWTTPSDSLNQAWAIEDTVYVSYRDVTAKAPQSWVKALDLATGRERWSYSLRGNVQLVDDREVYIQDYTDRERVSFVVVDRQTGAFQRRISLRLESSVGPRGPVLADGVIYISGLAISNVTMGFYASADNDSWLNAFDATTGNLLWRTSTLYNHHLKTPIIEGDRLFVASDSLEPDQSSVIQAFAIPD